VSGLDSSERYCHCLQGTLVPANTAYKARGLPNDWAQSALTESRLSTLSLSLQDYRCAHSSYDSK